MIEQMNTINLFYPLLFIAAIILTFVIARSYKDKLDYKKDVHFKDKDVEVTTEAFKRIGEVKNGTPNEIVLNLQNVENNKEIHGHNVKIEKLEELVEFLQTENANLRADVKILQNKFDGLTKIIGREI